MEKPLVSIVTPTYNSEDYLEETIKSVVNQTYDNIEYIVVDGASDDRTLDILREYDQHIAKWVSAKDRGMYDAISKGFSISNGSILAWINSDDILEVDAVEKVVRVFLENKRVEWITGVPTVIMENGNKREKYAKVFPQWVIASGYAHGLGWGFIQQESTFFKRALYDSVGGISVEYRLVGDADLWMKFASKASLISVNFPIGCFRIREGQLSADKLSYFNEGVGVGFRRCKLLKPISFLYSFICRGFHCKAISN